MAPESSNKRLFKNTLYLYIRMLFTMVVSLYTSRVVLKVLGVCDYGIYNVIGGLVVLISILNNSMSAATQRFITFELGKGNVEKVLNTFKMSMTIHILICITILFVGETFGVYYIHNFLSIPQDRASAALWVFQISLITIVFNVLRAPYNASIIAYERMSFYAIISIVETMLQLLISFLLIVCKSDKLILYSLFILLATALITFVYKRYCNNCFQTCSYSFYIDKIYFKQLLSFLGWNFVGAISTTGCNQMGNLMMNYFCGPTVNAAYGVATRVNAAVTGFTNNFQVAYTPQITKLYSQNEKETLFQLMNRSAILSYYLLFIIAVPLCFQLDYALNLWLVEVPPLTPIFIKYLILYNLIDSLQAPFWKVINATGNIKVYEVWLNLVLITNIPISFFFLKRGFPPYIVVLVSVSLNFLTAIIRTIHTKIQIGVSIKGYIKRVIGPAVFVSSAYVVPVYFLQSHYECNSIIDFCGFYVLSFIYISIIIFAIGIHKEERSYIIRIIKTRVQG